MLPTISLSSDPVTRLIIGGNPFSGNSHISSELDEAMEDYFTTETIKATLRQCEAAGINTMQVRGDRHMLRMLREYRLEGGRMHWIAQTAPEMVSFEGNLHQILKAEPTAIYHHGTMTDQLFLAGEYDQIIHRLEIMQNTGVPVGLGTHIPEVIDFVESNCLSIDFYMCSVHNLSKVQRVSSAVTGQSNTDEPFDEADRKRMYEAVRFTDKPCLVFKILGAGRRCQSTETVRQAFAEALANIKPSDGLVVGMYPKDKDQVAENAAIVRELMT